MNKPIKDYPVSAEQYLIENYEKALERNLILKKEKEDLLIKIQALEPESISKEDVKVLPELMTLYSINTAEYNIERKNIEEWEKKLEEKSLDIHDHYGNYYISTHIINAKIMICKVMFYCNVRFKGVYSQQDITVYDINDKRYYQTLEEAKSALYKKLEEHITSRKERWAKEDVKEKEVKENEKTV